MEQVKAYIIAVETPHSLLHEVTKDVRGTTEGVCLGWTKQKIGSGLQLNMPADKEEQIKECGQHLNHSSISASETILSENLKHIIENHQQARWIQRSIFSLRKTINRWTSQCTLMDQVTKDQPNEASL